MDQLSLIPKEEKPEYVAWPVRFPFTALINGVERVYSEPAKPRSLAEQLRAASARFRECGIPRSG